MGEIDTVCFLNLALSPVADEYRFSSPFDDDIFAFRDRREVDLDFREGQNIFCG